MVLSNFRDHWRTAFLVGMYVYVAAQLPGQLSSVARLYELNVDTPMDFFVSNRSAGILSEFCREPAKSYIVKRKQSFWQRSVQKSKVE